MGCCSMGVNFIFDFYIKLFLLFHSVLGWKTHKSAIATVQLIYYNFMKPHEVLEGKTLSEKVGIKIEGKDKWKGLLKNPR